ncbi:MAG TPA: IPT/TIG domain-containing protein, partial [Terracidiphilus sp.]
MGCIAIAVFFTACAAPAQVAPATPPAQICGSSILTNPNGSPSGATIVPAGDNTNVNFGIPGMTYYFLAGTHTLGTSYYGQIIPGDNSTFIGAPGAVIDGQYLNNDLFEGTASNVTIQYLTIQHFGVPPVVVNGQVEFGNNGGSVVNYNAGAGWTVQYNTIANNHGAGVDSGDNGVISYNCLDSNGEYGLNIYAAPTTQDEDYSTGPGTPANVTIDHNEISNNDTDNWESLVYGCGCSGGFKLWNSQGTKITNNWVHDNKNVGMWADTNNYEITITGNYVANNYGEGIIIEISYNALIQYNTFVGNAIVNGQAFLGNFPESAIYISESGGEPLLSNVNTPLDISYNDFVDNWGGVVLWEAPDRFCDNVPTTDPSYNSPYNLCTKLVSAQSGECVAGTINNQPYYSECRWHTQNVDIHNNTFSFNPADFPASYQNCLPACGVSGVFSKQGSYPPWSPYQGPNAIDNAITFNQNNVWENNQYTGPWSFKVFDQFAPDTLVTSATWQAAPYNQDAGSTFNDSYAAPIILGLSPVFGPPGTSVTISGTNFGATQSSSTLTFNGAPVMPMSWSATSIVASVPAGANTGNFVVTVGGVANNNGSALTTFTVTPVIASLSPGSGPVGTSVTVSGTNFGATQGSSTVTFNGASGTPTSWSNTSIVVQVPSGASSGNVVVTVANGLVPSGGVSSNGVNYNVGSMSSPPAGNFLDAATSTLDVAGSLGAWEPWYSASISQSAAAAQGGTADGLSIAINANGGWGVTSSNYPGFAATPGPGTISFWAMNGSGSGNTVHLEVQWLNSSGGTIQTDCAPAGCSGF